MIGYGPAMIADLAIIIPLAPGDTSWTTLLQDLMHLPAGVELIFTGPKPPQAARPTVSSLAGDRHRISWIRTPLGRARQMNTAARATKRRFLWFLHADSRIDRASIDKLGRALTTTPGAIHYFDLAFDTGGLPFMALNNGGVWVRSHWLGMPFGDQGFCLERELFLLLGGYDEEAPYGEDHLLIWKARRAGVPIKCTGARLVTSPRKYQDRGWLATTWRHVSLTAKQAWPEAIKTLEARRGKTVDLSVAAFVKTPGRSPVKTRLAAGIGTPRANELYELSVRAVESVLHDAVRRGVAEAFWAVAESDASPAWDSLPVVLQGEGGLGARIATVYEALAQSGATPRAAVLIGADAPQIRVRHLEAARLRLVEGYDFVLGPAADGGFYLFASARDIPRELFESVPYSAANTAAELAKALAPLGRIAWLETLTDVDTVNDLAPLAEALAALPNPTSEQRHLANWLDQ